MIGIAAGVKAPADSFFFVPLILSPLRNRRAPRDRPAEFTAITVLASDGGRAVGNINVMENRAISTDAGLIASRHTWAFLCYYGALVTDISLAIEIG